MSFRQTLYRAARRVLISWTALAIAGAVVLRFPPYPRFY